MYKPSQILLITLPQSINIISNNKLQIAGCLTACASFKKQFGNDVNRRANWVHTNKNKAWCLIYTDRCGNSGQPSHVGQNRVCNQLAVSLRDIMHAYTSIMFHCSITSAGLRNSLHHPNRSQLILHDCCCNITVFYHACKRINIALIQNIIM